MEPEGSEKYKEVNNNNERCVKKAKENWIGEQCSEIDENLRRNYSKGAYQLAKDLTTRSIRKMPHRRTRNTEPMDRILH